ncbi:MAG: hypothetical protein ACRERY_17970, partial [Pseudomonas sp.]
RFHGAPQPAAGSLHIAGRDSAWSRSRSHGGFDNDLSSMNGLLQLVLGAPAARPFKAEELQGY